MAKYNDAVLDAGLAEITSNATLLHLCTSEPADFSAVAAASLGSTGVAFDAPADNAGTGGGRAVKMTPANDTTYDASGTVSHWALVDGTRLLASGAVPTPKAVNSGDTINAAAADLVIRDAVAV